MVFQVKFNKRKFGFSLIELIIVIGILGLFISISTSVYNNFKTKNNLEITSYSIVEGMRQAQSNSQKMKEDSKWGIKILGNSIVIFKGNTYAARDAGFDQNLDFASGVSATGNNEIIFDKITGWTTNTGTTTVSGFDLTKEININAKGTITY